MIFQRKEKLSLAQMNLCYQKFRFANPAWGVQHRTAPLFTARESEKETSGKLFSSARGVGPGESFLDICVLEAHPQQGVDALLQRTHGVSTHSSS